MAQINDINRLNVFIVIKYKNKAEILRGFILAIIVD